MPSRPDLPHRLAEALLTALVQRLVDADQPVDWASVYGGNEVFPPSDDCDGIAWVRVNDVTVSDGSGGPLDQFLPVDVPAAPAFTFTFHAGVLRCAMDLTELGEMPDPDTVLAETVRDSVDRQALLLATSCDLPPAVTAEFGDAVLLGAWLPLRPGAFSGGYQTVAVTTTNLIGAPS